MIFLASPGWSQCSPQAGVRRRKTLRSTRRRLQIALDGCGAPRRGDLDGCGNLSQSALDDFRRFFLRVSNDQVTYMSSILQPSELLRRMEIYVEGETRAGRLPKGSFPLLREALFAGEFERGQAPALTAYKERMARSVVSKLLEVGQMKN